MQQHHMLNGDVSIHYIEKEGSEGTTPLIVIPGMIEPAEAYAAPMKDVPWHCYFISLRGRGHSGSPPHGYGLDDQVSDVLALVDHLGLDGFHLMGHSVGVAVAIESALRMPDAARSLILSDYLPYYPQFGDEWVESVLAYADRRISDRAVRGLAEESAQKILSRALVDIAWPVLITRGGKEGSLLPEELVRVYTDNLADARVEVLASSGHEPFEPDPAPFLNHLIDFLRAHDPRPSAVPEPHRR